MKVILWWNLSRDESHDSQRSDDRWRFASNDVYDDHNLKPNDDDVYGEG